MAASSSTTVVIPGGSSKKDRPKRVSGPSKVSWANVVASASTSNPSAKKLNLKFIQPELFEGRPRVIAAAEISVEGAKRWATSLVGCFVGGSLPFAAVNNIADASGQPEVWSMCCP